MPGIVGLITKKPREWAEPILGAMLQAVRHESFYRTGTWVEVSSGVYVGWTVQENSFSDGMPVSNERGDLVLVFSGENFPESGTKSRLREHGHVFAPEGPSYLVHLSEEDDTFPATLNGKFQGMLIDRLEGTALLFNDRYGMHRLYYHESKDAFYFAVEAKAILAVCPELRRVDAQGLGEFVACGCVLQNRTLFDGIHVLPGGSAWLFRKGALESKKSYFQPREWEEQAPLEPEEYYRELKDKFSSSLPHYFNGRQKVGISLTGGLDTRLILAWWKSQPNTLPCYTYAGMFRDCQDVIVARKVADICRQPHRAITVGNEFLPRFAHYAERSVFLSDGCVDVSRASDLYVSEKVREIAPVRIVGTYGSEMLTQVAMFKAIDPMPGIFSQELLQHVNQAKSTYAEIRSGHPATFAAFRQSPWWHYGVLTLEQSQLTVRSPYLDNELVRTVYRAPASLAATGDVRLRMIGDGDPTLGRIRSDRGIGGNALFPASMISRGFLEFTLRAEYAYDQGMPQWLAKIDHFFSPLHFERLFLGRHKFAHYRIWYRDFLSEYVREMLLDSRSLSRPYLERGGLEAVVQGHLKGNRNYTNEIHTLLTLELLHRQFLDSN